MLIDSDDPPAVPLWVNGHAYLTMAPTFLDVCNPADGRVLRRTPLCTSEIAGKVVEVALIAGDGWRALTELERSSLCLRLADALVEYSDHFGRLIAEETGKTEAGSGAEVTAALAVLRQSAERRSADEKAVVAIIGDADTPLLGPLRVAVPVLMAGNVVVIRPDPTTPSVLVALAELTGRCGFPPGVFNVVHGGDAVLAGLRELNGVTLLFA